MFSILGCNLTGCGDSKNSRSIILECTAVAICGGNSAWSCNNTVDSTNGLLQS